MSRHLRTDWYVSHPKVQHVFALKALILKKALVITVKGHRMLIPKEKWKSSLNQFRELDIDIISVQTWGVTVRKWLVTLSWQMFVPTSHVWLFSSCNFYYLFFSIVSQPEMLIVSVWIGLQWPFKWINRVPVTGRERVTPGPITGSTSLTPSTPGLCHFFNMSLIMLMSLSMQMGQALSS